MKEPDIRFYKWVHLRGTFSDCANAQTHNRNIPI